MRKTACTVGALLASSGILMGGTAFADSADNNGINIGNDNNASVLPTQLCGDNVAIVGAVVPVASPQSAQCAGNGPILDHPVQQPTQMSPTQQPPTEQSAAEKSPNETAGASSSSSALREAPSPVVVSGHHAVTG